MSDDNVVKLSTKMTLQPVRAKYTGCRCTEVLVDEETRSLECQRCSKTIDPFDYLWKYAMKQQRIVFNLSSAEHENERLNKSVTELKRQERNIKARIRRVKATS